MSPLKSQKTASVNAQSPSRVTTSREPYLKKFYYTLLVLILLCIIFFSLISVIVSVFILDTFQSIEEKDMESRMNRFSENLNNSIAYVGKTVADYAVWDDMARFTEGSYPAFSNEGMSQDSFKAIGIDIVAILNDSGDIIYEDDYTNPVGDKFPLQPVLSGYIQSQSPLVQNDENITGLTSLVFHTKNTSGILVSHPVQYHTTGTDGEGYVIMGRYFHPAYLQELSIILDEPAFLADKCKVEQLFPIQDEHPGQRSISTQVINESAIASYLKIPDPLSKETTYFGVIYPRKLYQEGLSTLTSYLLVILAV
ncbi:CHASE4 domain-containing protein [Methanospirillum stamsii]|uniref:CHASE4 domain-containing protein n=1 Tax=Methanospirillum stamsii TaxID=1277351 RepID=A0A2V2NKQ5_9EURY|nr:CHASE4 domain-containing protein [Methanospirillum stamsii]PWR75923.1 hypothetical protein DLD82_02360 [Methanospirillum stamsii]